MANWYCCSPYVANPLRSFSLFSKSSIRDPTLRAMVNWYLLPLYLPGSGRASRETAISGFCQQTIPDTFNSVQVWHLYMGCIPTWCSLLVAFPLVSAPYFTSAILSGPICRFLILTHKPLVFCSGNFPLWQYFFYLNLVEYIKEHWYLLFIEIW